VGEIEFLLGKAGPSIDTIAYGDGTQAVNELGMMKPTEFIRRHYPPFVAMHNELSARRKAEYRA